MSVRVCEPCPANGSTKCRAVLCHLFCVKLGENSTTTRGKLQQAFGNDAMSGEKTCHWHKMFSEGRTLVEDEQCSGLQQGQVTTQYR